MVYVRVHWMSKPLRPKIAAPCLCGLRTSGHLRVAVCLTDALTHMTKSTFLLHTATPWVPYLTERLALWTLG